MKAIVINEHGPSEILKMDEVANPTPKPNEVVVRLKAASLNYVDFWVRKGSPAYPVSLPHVMGADGAGVVEEMGDEAEGIEQGSRVLIVPGLWCGVCAFCRTNRSNQCEKFEILGTKRPGTYAERVAVPDQNVVAIPDHLSFEEAAAFPLAYLTAWHMLIGRAKLNSGETVVITGAGGGVGVAAIQIAKWKRGKVLATTSTPEKAERIRSLGAEDVFVQSADKKDFSSWVLEKTGGKGADVVVEVVGPATWEASMKSLGKYGRLVTCGATTGPSVSLDLRVLFSRDSSILGARMGTHKEFQELADLVFSGAIKPRIDRTFPLSEAAQAHAYMESKQHFGKVVLSVG